MDWKEVWRSAWPILQWAWPVVAGTPGGVAFFWNWRDRRRRRLSEEPYAEWRFDKEPDENGWYATEISVKNRWDEPLYGRYIEVKGMRGTQIAILQPPQGEGKWLPDFSNARSSLPVDWTFWTSSRTGNGTSSGGTFIYVKPPKSRKSGAAQSGKGSPDTRMSRLRLEISLISASNRKARVSAMHRWTERPIIRRKKAEVPTT